MLPKQRRSRPVQRTSRTVRERAHRPDWPTRLTLTPHTDETERKKTIQENERLMRLLGLGSNDGLGVDEVRHLQAGR